MKKETFFAILLGVIAGVGIATIIISQSREANLEKTQKTLDTISITPAIKLKDQPFESLSVESPIDKTSTQTDSITISGKAPIDSLVIIQSPYSEVTAKAENGTFSQEFPLKIGENKIGITAYKAQEIDTKTLTIFYIEP